LDTGGGGGAAHAASKTDTARPNGSRTFAKDSGHCASETEEGFKLADPV
jgi:hypothetical protein